MSKTEKPCISFTSIPEGHATCTVSVINNAELTLPLKLTLSSSSDSDNTSNVKVKLPVFSFLVTHLPSGTKSMFDLGLRFDWESVASERVKETVQKYMQPLRIDADVAQILQDGGVEPDSITNVFISHSHFDHSGLISSFPNATVVATPATLAGEHVSFQLEGMNTHEIKFNRDAVAQVGAFDHGIDFFGDGSFWLLDAPGHIAGHVVALVRTTPSPDATYILLTSDTCHHVALLSSNPCFGHLYLGTMVEDEHAAWDTVQRARAFEAQDNVMAVMAHDSHYAAAWSKDGHMFPKGSIEGWKEKGLKLERKFEF